MPFKITVTPVYSSKKEAEIVKLCKYQFIDRLNFSGVQYDAIHFVSKVLNEAIKLFDKDTSVDLIFPQDCKPKPFDISTIEAYAHEFLNNLRECQISKILFDYIQNLIQHSVRILDTSFNSSGKR